MLPTKQKTPNQLHAVRSMSFKRLPYLPGNKTAAQKTTLTKKIAFQTLETNTHTHTNKNNASTKWFGARWSAPGGFQGSSARAHRPNFGRLSLVFPTTTRTSAKKNNTFLTPFFLPHRPVSAVSFRHKNPCTRWASRRHSQWS